MKIPQVLHFGAVLVLCATLSKNQLLLSSWCEINSILSIRGRLALLARHDSLWFADYSRPIWTLTRFFISLLLAIFRIGVIPRGGTLAWTLKSLSTCQATLWFKLLRLLNIDCVCLLIWIHYLQVIFHKDGRIFSAMALDFQVLLQIWSRWRPRVWNKLFTVVSLTDGDIGALG